VYFQVFYKNALVQKYEEGQGLFTILTGFFWVLVYLCLSSIWSILYSLIDIKFPDVIGAAQDYAYGLQGSGYVYDTFAFPLAMIVVSSLTALALAFFLISKFQKHRNLRPVRLYMFMRSLVFIGGALLIFFGFVYVVYSWLYGNLPVAVFLKAAVAVVIVGMVAWYFYLTADGKNPNESMIGKMFAGMLVLATAATMFFSFSIVGTPAQARQYRLDSITLQNLQTVKQEIDSQTQNFGMKIENLSELNSDYVKSILRKNEIKYSRTEQDFTLCAEFNGDMPQIINLPNRDETWDYVAGENCFTFKHQPVYPNAQTQPKPVFVK
jgi:hypothetical protein